MSRHFDDGRSYLRRASRRPGAWLLLVVLVASIAGLAACSVFEPKIDYETLAAELPDMDDLAERATAFRSTLIYDRDGNLLNEAFDPNAGKRTVVPLNLIAQHLQQATIATEDARFYEHGGVDPIAVARAAWYLVREGEVVSGASTIPQQLVKRLYLTPERSVKRKVIEAALAREISGRYGKDEILTLYLNEIYYGNMAYGAQAAAATYFGKNASDVTLAEAALLAGLPQAPAYLDPYANPERAKRRQRIVLGLMAEAGYITKSEAEQASDAPLDYRPPRFDLKAPHFTLFVREQVEQLFGPEALYSRGLNVYTTLDSVLQGEAEAAVHEHVATLVDRGASNGALVAIRPDTGEIVALVGSADFYDESIDGQINMALAPRQPGSALKPFVYLTAFETAQTRDGDPWTPGTLIADVIEAFPDGANAPYVPTNYDDEEHGLVTVRSALANSYNIPAVKALRAVGIPAYVDVSRRVGITTLNRQDYGLSLALGSGEVPLVQVAGAFAVLANGGLHTPPIAIRRITDSTGEVLCELGSDTPCDPDAEGIQRRQAIDPADAFLLTDILSDNQARLPGFGAGSWLEIGRPAAVKTGTTNDTRDGWTVGYTPDLVTGVWVGNADNSPMTNVSGYSAAAPIWNRFMKSAHANREVTGFVPPKGVEQVVVCADTGAEPGPACPDRRVRWFASDRPPLPSERDLWQTFDGQPFKWFPIEYRWWAELHGIPQPRWGMLPDGHDAEPDESLLTASPTATASRTVTVTTTTTATATGTTTRTPTTTATLTPTARRPSATPTPTYWQASPFATNTPHPVATAPVEPSATRRRPTATVVLPSSTPMPPTATPVPPTATLEPPTVTLVPPTDVPPTAVAPTAVAPTTVPPTAVQPTAVQPTPMPPPDTPAPPSDTAEPPDTVEPPDLVVPGMRPQA